MSRRTASLVATILSSGLMMIATQLEWVRSGSAGRNSYEMFRSAQRLGLDELTPFRVVWFLLPVMCLGAVLMASLARHHVAAALLGVASVVSLGIGVAVILSGIDAGLGAPLGLGAGLAGLVSAGVALSEGRSKRRRSATDSSQGLVRAVSD